MISRRATRAHRPARQRPRRRLSLQPRRRRSAPPLRPPRRASPRPPGGVSRAMRPGRTKQAPEKPAELEAGRTAVVTIYIWVLAGGHEKVNITADAVKQLRERTGAGMMECKKALVETKGDLDAAAELMRKQGLAKADKKATRVAAEGVIVIEKSADGRTAAMVEINCETDFVAREQDFRGFAQAVAAKALVTGPASLESLLAVKLDSGETIEERRRALVAKIGENISVRRSVVLSSQGNLGAYVHGTRIGAIVVVKGGDATLAHDLAMHVAASNPKYLAMGDVPAEVVAKEREILT